MKLPGYYSSGEFARMAQVSLRTIRYYDKKNILKPSYVNPSGARFYTDADFVKLQQILLLKYLGFTLSDIKEMTVNDPDYHFMLNSLKLQKRLVEDRMEQMQLVSQAIENTVETIENHNQIDWTNMMDLIHLTGMEQSYKSQYQNASNISARIRLHREFSENPQGWFPWIFEQLHLKEEMKVLELGCGSGALWTENMNKIPPNIKIILSDISEGMIRDVRRSIHTKQDIFDFQSFDCHNIPYEDETFDVLIANHVLFYCDDIKQVCREIKRTLKPDGYFICSTYGKQHMKEITDLVQEFDSRIVLSADVLYDRFGLENGKNILEDIFQYVECLKYDDSIELDQAEPLIEYILSCHGNQNQILLDKYTEFRSFVEKKVKNGFHITKDAGIFRCWF